MRNEVLSLLAVPVVLALTATGARATPLPQDALGRVQLEHEDYDKWSRLSSTTLSEDGRWAAFVVQPAEGAGTLELREVASQRRYTIENGSRPRFTFDGARAAYLVVPDPELIERLQKDEKRKGPLPKPALEILELESGRKVRIADVDSFTFPEEGDGWIAYSPVKSPSAGELKAGRSPIEEAYAIQGGALAPAAPAAKPGSLKGKDKKKEKEKEAREKKNGDVLVLRELATGLERRIPDVSSYRFGKRGQVLVYATSATAAEDDGVFAFDLAAGELHRVAAGRGAYRSLAISEDESMVAFLTDRHDYGPVKASMSLYMWTRGDEEARLVADAKSEALPEGWWLAPRGLTFTEDGRRLLFETQPRPEDAGKTKEQLEKEKKAKAKDPVARLDVWHWKDDALQPQQLIEAERERNRAYRALYDIGNDKVVQLATEEIPRVSVDRRGSADVAVGTSNRPYAISRSWESPGFADTYIVDLGTGAAERVLEKVRGTGSLSPGGTHVTWWDPEQERHYAMSVADREIVDLTGDLPVPFADELNDRPMPPRSYRGGGWLEGDAAVLLYDRYDIWAVDPSGAEAPRCVTGDGQGRETRTRYRIIRSDLDARFVPAEGTVFVSIFDERTKASGIGVLDIAAGTVTPELVLDERVRWSRKAQGGDTVLLTRETFRRFPDLWATTTEFETLTRLSDANPQQRDHLWGTAELVDYESANGEPLQGLLYKPDNFRPEARYPMMVYFYERNSDGLHSYVTPAAGRASINYAFYVSRGYVIFVPDIPYAEGYPGQSAADAILPGIERVVDMGFVDPERIGVQGHSWGGYQIAYLVTMTDVFACAEAGAPVTNMTSAYGGIRWASGLSRMFQYERTQSRIGKTLWEGRDLYLENSPVFFADKVNTPLLILHNDEDGAVPWYQGIEMFVALRRLGKPVWMLNYNGEAHGLRREENRLDFAKRMQQFFDHHLMDAPATKWIAEGVPATVKGKDLGLGPVEETEAEAKPEAAEERPGEVSSAPATATSEGQR